jgi:hypothetical protein
MRRPETTETTARMSCERDEKRDEKSDGGEPPGG